MDSFVMLFNGAFKLLNKKYTLPWFGSMSILQMLVVLALLDMLVWFVRGLLGGADEDE